MCHPSWTRARTAAHRLKFRSNDEPPEVVEALGGGKRRHVHAIDGAKKAVANAAGPGISVGIPPPD
jgi:hypothetical protein